MLVGRLGEAQVQEALLQVNWAPAVKIDQDIGDDLLSFARVSVPKHSGDGVDVFDLSIPVVIQVKSSRAEYLKPKKRQRDNSSGWWYMEGSKGEFDHWIKFGLPYFLVLQDVENRTSYWALVDGASIEKPPTGQKIWVPHEQRIDTDGLEELTKAVLKHRDDRGGGTWSGRMKTLPPGQRLRHALVVPRLVAPHPNKTPDAVSSEEAVALVLLDRTVMLHRYAERGLNPPLDAWLSQKEWGWKFAGSLRAALDGDSSPMQLLVNSAKSKPERDAAMIVIGCAQFVAQGAESALDRFVPDRYSRPADRGWLMAHRAHMLFETGDSKEAAVAVRKALVYLASGVGDASVAALRAGCAQILYLASDWGSAPAQSVLDAQENLGSLWRAQVVSSALAMELDDRFRAWAGDETVHMVTSTPTSSLTAAAWNAAFSSAWGTWRELSAQVAQIELVTDPDPDTVREALWALVRTGHKEQSRHASWRLWLDGPLDQLKNVASSLTSEPWSLRMEGAVFAVLREAGDLLTSAEADTTIDRILTLLRTDGDERRHGNSVTLRWFEIHRALARMLDAASASGHKACAEVICEKFPTGVSEATSLLRVAATIDMTSLPTNVLDRLVEAASRRDDQYRASLLQLVGASHRPAVNALRSLDKAGDPYAARALVVSGENNLKYWAALGRKSARDVLQMVDDSRQGLFRSGAGSSLHDLTLAAFHSRNLRHWKIITDALAAGVLQGSEVAATVGFLAHHFRELPASVQARLRKMAPNLSRSRGVVRQEDSGFDAAALALRLASGAITEGAAVPAILKLKSADPAGSLRILEIMPSGVSEGILLACVVDPNVELRSFAGHGLVELARRDPPRTAAIAEALLAALAVNDGARMPLAIATALGTRGLLALESVRDLMKNHPSAAVREKVS